jgi:hypothetical protein
MPQAQITPITAADLDEIGRFLHENLNRRISVADWIGSLTHPWSESRPNYGMQLRDDGKLVGVLCAIYSDQTIDGRVEKFCNPHSWCVLEAYRNQGIGLVLSVVKQRGYHYTMLTPNPKVAEIFRHLRFKDLADGFVIFPNLPIPSFGGTAVADPAHIGEHLDAATRHDYELHRDIRWLRFVAFGKPGDMCLVAYKPNRWKKMRGARIIFVSDPSAFERHRHLLQSYLFWRQGMLVSHVESRFLSVVPRLAYRTKRLQGKLFLSPTLKDAQIRDLYSELASLDV